ncbi:MAG: hypothetical protein Q4B60_07750 [Erysipelotrichaceae bacterium]|nr:hypothetical protein [Erysipelotrichaceae bacterium]
MNFRMTRIGDEPDLKDKLTEYLNNKWVEEKPNYLRSINDAIRARMILPQWYILLADEEVIGTAGVLENQIIGKPEFSPNICSLYVEEEYKEEKIDDFIDFIYDDVAKAGIEVLYLVEDVIEVEEEFLEDF